MRRSYQPNYRECIYTANITYSYEPMEHQNMVNVAITMENYAQFLNTVFVMVSVAALNFLLAMLEVLGMRRALGGLHTLFLECRQNLITKINSVFDGLDTHRPHRHAHLQVLPPPALPAARTPYPCPCCFQLQAGVIPPPLSARVRRSEWWARRLKRKSKDSL